MTPHELTYEIRDDQLPDRPPLATAADYSGALAELQRLHEEFRDQIAAGGEGGNTALQRLAIDEILDGEARVCRHLSSVNGCR